MREPAARDRVGEEQQLVLARHETPAAVVDRRAALPCMVPIVMLSGIASSTKPLNDLALRHEEEQHGLAVEDADRARGRGPTA